MATDASCAKISSVDDRDTHLDIQVPAPRCSLTTLGSAGRMSALPLRTSWRIRPGRASKPCSPAASGTPNVSSSCDAPLRFESPLPFAHQRLARALQARPGPEIEEPRLVAPRWCALRLR